MTAEQKFQTVSLEALKSYLEDVRGIKNLEVDSFLDTLNPHNFWIFLHDLGSNGSYDGIGAGYEYGQPWFTNITTCKRLKPKDIAAIIHLEALDGATLQEISGEYGNRIDMESLLDDSEMDDLVETFTKLDINNVPIRLEAIIEGRILVYGEPLLGADVVEYLTNHKHITHITRDISDSSNEGELLN